MLSCWDVDPEQRPTFAQLVTTITSVLDPLADYLDISTFTTGEEPAAETTIMESEVVENEHTDEASKEEWWTSGTDLQDGVVVKNEGAEECISEKQGSYSHAAD